MPPVSSEAVLKRLTPHIRRLLGQTTEALTPETYLEDLGASSLDLVEITLEVEQEFGVLLAGRPFLHEAVLAFGPDKLEVDGELTDAGRRLIHRRFPHLRADEVAEMVDISDVQRQVSRLSVWIEAISELAEQIPERCAAGGGRVQVSDDGVPVCSGAGEGYRPPSLEDWNRAWIERFREEENGKSDEA